MLNLDYLFGYFFGYINTPTGIGLFAGFMTMFYLVLMSINSYLPPVLLLSLTIGYIVYYVQRNCRQCNIIPQIPNDIPLFPPQSISSLQNNSIYPIQNQSYIHHSRPGF